MSLFPSCSLAHTIHVANVIPVCLMFSPKEKILVKSTGLS